MRKETQPSGHHDCDALPKTGTVSMADTDARQWWSKAFGVSEALLTQAVRIVGDSISDLRKLFCRD
jgi:hypothetical protein